MTRIVPTDLKLALPVLILTAGKVTDNELSLIEELENQVSVIESRNLTNVVEFCTVRKINMPQYMKMQFIYCPTVESYLDASTILTRNNHLPFFSAFATVVIIDYSANKNIQEIRSEITKALPKRNNTGFVYYKATEELINLFDEKTHISFDSYNLGNASAHLRTFLTTYGFSVIQEQPDFNEYISLMTKKSERTILVRTSFMSLSSDVNEGAAELLLALKDADYKDKYSLLAFIYELMALMEIEDPGVLRRNQLLEKKPTYYAPWAFDDTQPSDALTCLSAAAGYANKAGFIQKAIDYGIKMISLGCVKYITPICSLIEQSKSYVDINLRVFNLISVCYKCKMFGKGAFAAHSLTNSFPKYRVRLLLETLNGFHKGMQGNMVIQNLEAPIILELVKLNVEPVKVQSIILSILNRAGPNLPVKTQKILFKALSNINICGSSESPIGITVKSCTPIPATYEIQAKHRPTVKSSSAIFIYNGLIKAKDAPKDLIVAANHPLKFEVILSNPFAGALPAVVSFPEAIKLKAERKPVTLCAKGETRVTLTATPLDAEAFELSAVQCSVYSSNAALRLPSTIRGTAVAGAAAFCARTDLPGGTFFEGQEVDFGVWVSNTGSAAISRAIVYFAHGASFVSEKPIAPGRELRIKCHVTADRGTAPVAFNVECAAEGDVSFVSVREFTIPVRVVPGLITAEVAPVREQLDVGADLREFAFVRVRVSNVLKAAFAVSAAFDDEGLPSHPALLSREPRSDFVPGGGCVSYIIPVRRADLLNAKGLASPPQLVAATSAMEEEVGRKLTRAERLKVARLTDALCLIGQRLKVRWTSFDGRAGVLPQPRVPAPDLLDELETVRCVPRVRLLDGADETDCHCAPAGTVLTLAVDFGEMAVAACALEIGALEDPARGLLWDGALSREGRGPVFEFRLCFARAGRFDFEIRYRADGGIEGTVPVSITAREVA